MTGLSQTANYAPGLLTNAHPYQTISFFGLTKKRQQISIFIEAVLDGELAVPCT